MDRDTITLRTASLYQAAYTVPLCSFFLYFTKLMLFGPSIIQLSGVTVSEDLHITFTDNAGQAFLQGYSEFNLAEGYSPVYCRFQQNSGGVGCLEVPSHQTIKVLEDDSGVDGVNCYKVHREGLRCASQLVKDCYSLGTTHWYGGFESLHQRWPLKQGRPPKADGILDEEEASMGVRLPMGPYLTADSGIHRTEQQNVLERVFITSTGVGISVLEKSPLYLSFNQHGDKQLCLGAMYDGAYYSTSQAKGPVLEYTVCKAPDVRQIHSYMQRRFLPKPQGMPSAELFSKPIWSTWALYNRNINQSAVLDFAGKIVEHQLPCAQVEIDDMWMQRYGDLEFDPVKFPDPGAMTSELTGHGFPVSLWTHPFLNLDSEAFAEAQEHNYLVKLRGSETVALTRWWNGQLAGLLDVTNPAAALWYHSRLTSLRERYNITAFKFDAGEALYMPSYHSTFVTLDTPNDYSTRWAEFAHSTDPDGRRQEVRTAWRSQHLPQFLRLQDRMSTWDEDGGLRTVIPSVLTLSILGYPFILPDMIGGNAYTEDIVTGHGMFPDKELFVRWLQVNTFFPSLQFSIPPWVYDEEVLTITKRMLALRDQFLPRIVELAQDSVKTGDPIIRPLWWVDPSNEAALGVGDQYLVGEDLLVAPVVVEGARRRDVVLPTGTWQAQPSGRVVQGPTVLKDLPVPLGEVLFFERRDST